MGFALSLVTQCLPITKAGRFLRKLNEVLLVVNEVGFFVCLFVLNLSFPHSDLRLKLLQIFFFHWK